MAKAEHGSGERMLKAAIRDSPFAMIITDPRLEDSPVTYVNEAFQRLTLYSREYALGRNCRFLQGPETDPADVARLRSGLTTDREFEVTLVNHKADGTPFRNQVLIAPIHGPDGELTAHFGLLREVADDTGAAEAGAEQTLALLRELQHRVKNHLSMIVSMIRIQAKREVTPESLKAVSRRIEALALLYEELLNDGTNGDGDGDGDGRREIDTGAYLSRIASVVSGLQPRAAIRVNVECEEIRLPFDHAARLGLLLSEFLTNALEHAFEGRKSGYVDVRFSRTSGGGVRLTVEDDGIGLPEGSDWPFGAPSIERQRERAAQDEGTLDTTGHGRKSGVGGSIVAALIDSLGASLALTRPKRGTIVTVDLEGGD
ncbi:PAS domain-containing protein [Psychromarinibacter sp. C21-152]|uniref:PAS domain-containing protein n=1 Tax=Psychromarinibacter sediminicola TaxID=3033385 RepID=A0AAE3NXV8_9RHOB|nr:ATP-binding protein [Psychromarinibacter sediminicola]MDF0602955.1 PAS domain-containing protein [Psychromarinibacter sediminicola]